MTRYAKSKQEALQELLYKFYLENQSRGKNFTFLHFEAENMSKSTIYRIIQHAVNRLGSKRRIGSGRKPKIMDTKGKQKLKVMFEQSDKVSQMQTARSFKCSQQYICKTLKRYTSIRKIVIPMQSEELKAEARKRCERLYRNFKNLIWIIYDESIFKLSYSSSNGISKFYTNNIRLASEGVKYKRRRSLKII